MAVSKALKVMDARRDSMEVVHSKDDTTDTTDSRPNDRCNACPYCSDTCDDPSCFECDKKLSILEGRSIGSCGSDCQQYYTMCEIRRHNTADSAWIIAGDTVYDATDYVRIHPGGERSILRKAGGVADCTVDLNFHSKNGRKVWRKCIIGKIKKCPGEGNHNKNEREREWWMFWV